MEIVRFTNEYDVWFLHTYIHSSKHCHIHSNCISFDIHIVKTLQGKNRLRRRKSCLSPEEPWSPRHTIYDWIAIIHTYHDSVPSSSRSGSCHHHPTCSYSTTSGGCGEYCKCIVHGYYHRHHHHKHYSRYRKGRSRICTTIPQIQTIGKSLLSRIASSPLELSYHRRNKSDS